MAVSLILLVLSIILFYYTMSEYANVFVKSFIGSGDILVNYPLDNEFITLNARWGPSYGFYINIAAAVLMFILIAFSLNKFLKTRYRIITLKVNK